MAPPSPHEDFSFVPGQPLPQQGPFPASDLQSASGNPYEDEEIAGNDDLGDSPSALSDWKATLRADFESWLDTLEQIPAELTEDPDLGEDPDLATIFGDLSSLALESRKSNRRTAEAFSQWNTVLTGFQDDLKRFRERERALSDRQAPPEAVPVPLAAFLVDFHDRLTRIAQAQACMPVAKPGFFGNDTPWKTAWNNQRSALDITLSHLQAFLKEQGFQRIHTLDQALDPTRMAVIETRVNTDKPPHTVIEEITPGWLLGTRVLRPAQVIVSVAPLSTHS